MELSVFFKSVIDMDTAPIVLCDTNHIIIYINEIKRDMVFDDMFRCVESL